MLIPPGTGLCWLGGFYKKLKKNYFVCIGVGCPGTGVTESCGLPCGCWELNLGKRAVSASITTDPSPQT